MESINPLDLPVDRPDAPFIPEGTGQVSEPGPSSTPAPAPSGGLPWKKIVIGFILVAVLLVVAYAFMNRKKEKSPDTPPTSGASFDGGGPGAPKGKNVSFAPSHRDLKEAVNPADIKKIREMRRLSEKYAPLGSVLPRDIAGFEAGTRSLIYQATRAYQGIEDGVKSADIMLMDDAMSLLSRGPPPIPPSVPAATRENNIRSEPSVSSAPIRMQAAAVFIQRRERDTPVPEETGKILELEDDGGNPE